MCASTTRRSPFADRLYECFGWFAGANTHATARKTMTMMSSPITMFLNRKKQNAARTIAGVMMMKVASMRLQKNKRVKLGNTVYIYLQIAGNRCEMPTRKVDPPTISVREEKVAFAIPSSLSPVRRSSALLDGQTPRIMAFVYMMLHSVFAPPSLAKLKHRQQHGLCRRNRPPSLLRICVVWVPYSCRRGRDKRLQRSRSSFAIASTTS